MKAILLSILSMGILNLALISTSHASQVIKDGQVKYSGYEAAQRNRDRHFPKRNKLIMGLEKEILATHDYIKQIDSQLSAIKKKHKGEIAYALIAPGAAKTNALLAPFLDDRTQHLVFEKLDAQEDIEELYRLIRYTRTTVKE